MLTQNLHYLLMVDDWSVTSVEEIPRASLDECKWCVMFAYVGLQKKIMIVICIIIAVAILVLIIGLSVGLNFK